MRTYAQFLQGEACWRLTRLGRLDETAGDRRARARRGAQGRGRGGRCTTTPPTSPCAVAASTSAAEHFRAARELLGGTSDSMWIGNQAAGQAETALWARRSRARVADRHRRAGLRSRGPVRPLHGAPARDRAARRRRPRAARAGPRRRGAAPPRRRATPGRSSPASRALLAPERWHRRRAGPEPAAFDALSVAELARADGRPDPDAWDAAAERFAALHEPFELAYARWRQAEALIAGRRRPRRGRDRAARGRRDRRAPAGAAAGGRGRGPRPARARRRWTPRRTTAARGRRASTRWGSPSASSPSSSWSPRATPTARSARRCSSPRRPPACTSRGSWPSSACARASRRRPRRTASGWPRPQRQATAGAGRRPSCSS